MISGGLFNSHNDKEEDAFCFTIVSVTFRLPVRRVSLSFCGDTFLDKQNPCFRQMSVRNRFHAERLYDLLTFNVCVVCVTIKV